MSRSCCWLAALLFLIGSQACTPPPVRTGVPLWVGLNLADSCDLVPMVLKDAPSMEVAWAGYVFEVPLHVTRQGEPSDFRFYLPHTLDTLVAVLRRRQKPYLLHFDLANPHHLALDGLDPAPYFTTLSGMLLRTRTYPPAGIVFSGGLTDPAFAPGALPVFCGEIRQALPGFSGDLIFAAAPRELLAADFDWETPDRLGICYPPTQLTQSFSYQEFNQALGFRATQLHKPLFIAQTNLHHQPNLPALRRQLAHWAAEAQLSGLVVNDLFCPWPSPGRGPYQAFRRDGAFMRFLGQYAGGGSR